MVKGRVGIRLMKRGNMTESNETPQPEAPKKICKKCHASIPKYSDTCPQCGANLKPVYKKAWFWVVIVLVALLVMLGGCTAACSKSVVDNTNTISSSNGSSSTGSSSSSASQQKYTVADEQIVDKGYGIYTLTGTFTNTSGKEISYVQLEYVLKDASGAQVGTAYANTTNLASDTPWKFEAYCSSTSDSAPATFELKDVTGF